MNVLESGSPQTEISGEYFTPKLRATFKLVIAILERYLNSEWSKKEFQHIPRTFLASYNLLQSVTTYAVLTTNEEVYFELAHIMYLTYFIILCIDSREYMIAENEATLVFEKIFLLIETSTGKQFSESVMKLSHLAKNYWFLIHSRLLPTSHKNLKKKPLHFQNQLLAFQIMPLYMLSYTISGVDWNDEDVHDMRHDYMDKCFGELCEYTIRLVYNYRDLCFLKPLDYKLASKSIHYILDSIKCYVRESAVIIFQTFVYQLNDMLVCIKLEKQQKELLKTELDFYSTLLYTIRELIEIFDITWTACMESICVMNVVVDFISFTKWPKKVTVILFNYSFA